MEYVIVFVIGFALGWFVQGWIGARAFYEILKDLNVPDDKIMKLAERDGVDVSKYATEADAESAKTVIELKVEQVGDRLMAYRANDDFFVAQGADAAALFEEIVKQSPTGSRIEIVEGGDLVRSYVESRT
jgi:hypothetical protein